MITNVDLAKYLHGLLEDKVPPKKLDGIITDIVAATGGDEASLAFVEANHLHSLGGAAALQARVVSLINPGISLLSLLSSVSPLFSFYLFLTTFLTCFCLIYLHVGCLCQIWFLLLLLCPVFIETVGQ